MSPWWWAAAALPIWAGLVVALGVAAHGLRNVPVRRRRLFRLRTWILGTLVILTLPLVPIARRLDPEGWARADEAVYKANLSRAHSKELKEFYVEQAKRLPRD